MENWTNLDKGREGVKNPGNFADVICTWPLACSVRRGKSSWVLGGRKEKVTFKRR